MLGSSYFIILFQNIDGVSGDATYKLILHLKNVVQTFFCCSSGLDPTICREKFQGWNILRTI